MFFVRVHSLGFKDYIVLLILGYSFVCHWRTRYTPQETIQYIKWHVLQFPRLWCFSWTVWLFWGGQHCLHTNYIWKKRKCHILQCSTFIPFFSFFIHRYFFNRIYMAYSSVAYFHSVFHILWAGTFIGINGMSIILFSIW